MSRRQAQAARPAGKAPPGRPPHSASSPGWRQSAHCRRSGRAAAQPGGLPAQPWPRGDGRLPLRLRTYPRHLLVEGQNHIRSPKRNVRRLLWNAGGLGMEVSTMQMDRQCAGWRLSDPSRLCHMPSPACASREVCWNLRAALSTAHPSARSPVRTESPRTPGSARGSARHHWAPRPQASGGWDSAQEPWTGLPLAGSLSRERSGDPWSPCVGGRRDSRESAPGAHLRSPKEQGG